MLRAALRSRSNTSPHSLDAGRGAVGERQSGLAMAAAGAVLTRQCGVHGHHLPAGPCCPAGEQRRERGPRRVLKPCDQPMVRHQAAGPTPPARWGQRRRLPFTADAHKPLARRPAVDGGGLGHPPEEALLFLDGVAALVLSGAHLERRYTGGAPPPASYQPFWPSM